MSRHLRLWMLAALLWLPSGQAEPVKQSGLPVIAVTELPAEARDTLRAIKQGGHLSTRAMMWCSRTTNASCRNSRVAAPPTRY